MQCTEDLPRLDMIGMILIQHGSRLNVGKYECHILPYMDGLDMHFENIICLWLLKALLLHIQAATSSSWLHSAERALWRC